MAKKRCKSGFEIKSLDQFGVPIQMNIHGDSMIRNNFGATVSICLFVLLLAYSVKQASLVAQRSSNIIDGSLNEYF